MHAEAEVTHTHTLSHRPHRAGGVAQLIVFRQARVPVWQPPFIHVAPRPTCGIGMDVPSLRYDRTLLVLTPTMILTSFGLYVLQNKYWRPKLTPEAIKVYAGKEATAMTPRAWSKFHKNSSSIILSGFFHLWFGAAAFLATQYYLELDAVRILGDRGSLMATGDVEYVRLQETAAFLGSVFGALMLDYLFFWFLGWDRDPAQLAHHLIFLFVTLVLARRSAMAHSGLVAMAMEGSSPALNLMNTCRELDGQTAEKVTFAAFIVFSLLFVLLRCVNFGRAVVHVLYLRFTSPDGFPRHVPGWEIDLVVLMWLFGWLLQYVLCSNPCSNPPLPTPAPRQDRGSPSLCAPCLLLSCFSLARPCPPVPARARPCPPVPARPRPC